MESDCRLLISGAMRHRAALSPLRIRDIALRHRVRTRLVEPYMSPFVLARHDHFTVFPMTQPLPNDESPWAYGDEHILRYYWASEQRDRGMAGALALAQGLLVRDGARHNQDDVARLACELLLPTHHLANDGPLIATIRQTYAPLWLAHTVSGSDSGVFARPEEHLAV